MINPLTGLPSRALLDTNVVLDATFVADGYARRAVGRLGEFGYTAIIDDAIEREAKATLERLADRLQLSFDPKRSVDRLLDALRVMRLPAASAQSLGSGVHRSDAHVAAAARTYGAWVLTSDVVLAAECIGASIPVRLPWDVVAQGEVTLATVLRVMPPAADVGLIFARVIPGNWAGHRIADRFTVCDVENVGALYYVGDAQEWVFETKAGATARVASNVKPDQIWVVCGTYSLPTDLHKGSVTVRAAMSHAELPGQSSVTPAHPLRSNGPGRISFGHRVDGSSYWNGHLRCVVIGPHTISRETWRALLTVPEGAPNPFDANALERVLRLADQALRRKRIHVVNGIPEAVLRTGAWPPSDPGGR